jgi:hypothetical protein
MTTYRRAWYEVDKEDFLPIDWCNTCENETPHRPGRIHLLKGFFQALLYCTVQGCGDNQILLKCITPLPPDFKLFQVSVEYATEVNAELRSKPRDAYFYVVAKSRPQALYRAQQLEGVLNRFGKARYSIRSSGLGYW